MDMDGRGGGTGDQIKKERHSALSYSVSDRLRATLMQASSEKTEEMAECRHLGDWHRLGIDGNNVMFSLTSNI